MHDERCVPLTHGCWRELATARVIDTRDLPTVAVPAPWRVWAAQWAATHVALRPGPAWIDPPHVIDDNEGETCRVMAAAVAPHGYVAVHAGATWPREVWRTLCHRHVLLIPGDAPPMRVAALVRDLVGVSSRPHRIVRVVSSSRQVHERAPEPPPQPSASLPRVRAAWARAVRHGDAGMGQRAEVLCTALARRQTEDGWRRIARVVQTSAATAPLSAWLSLAGWDAQAQMAALDLERASALVAGAWVVAEVCGLDAPPALVRAEQQVAACTGRSSRVGDVVWTPPGTTTLARTWRAVQAGDRRASATARVRGLVGPFCQGGRVEQWSEVAELWRVVQESTADATAVTAACEWARTRMRAVGVSVVVPDTGRVVGSAGDPLAARAPDCLEAPVRYGGVAIAVMRASGVPVTSWGQTVLGLAAAACAPSVRARLDVMTGAESEHGPVSELIGRSPAMRTVRETILRVAATGFPVLVEGESGVGKELVARAIHRASGRRDRRLASVNCAALTDELFEAEVFGHARGAFTGAVGPRVGLFEEAHGGTLFLDEVAELSPRGQAKLLRALQEGEVRRLGENQGRAVDVRIVSATNRPLQAAARAGTFREDLVFRLAVVRLTVPPLRDRAEDIPELALAAWRRATEHRPTRAMLTSEAVAALCRYRWPGNVRELQNVMAALVLAAPMRGAVTAEHVAQVLDREGESAAVITLADARRSIELRVVRRAMARHAGCRTRAAHELGVTRQGLAKLLARLGPDV